jgi:hypothetical protein
MAQESLEIIRENSRAIAERFFRSLAEGDFNAYLDCLSLQRKRSRTNDWLRERFQKFATLQVQSWQLLDVLPQDDENVWVKYRIVYRAGAARGEDELELIKQGSEWKIERGDFC